MLAKADCKSKTVSAPLIQTGFSPPPASPISVKTQKHTYSRAFQGYNLNRLFIPLANTRTNILRKEAVYSGLASQKGQSVLTGRLWQSKAIHTVRDKRQNTCAEQLSSPHPPHCTLAPRRWGDAPQAQGRTPPLRESFLQTATHTHIHSCLQPIKLTAKTNNHNRLIINDQLPKEIIILIWAFAISAA